MEEEKCIKFSFLCTFLLGGVSYFQPHGDKEKGIRCCCVYLQTVGQIRHGRGRCGQLTATAHSGGDQSSPLHSSSIGCPLLRRPPQDKCPRGQNADGAIESLPLCKYKKNISQSFVNIKRQAKKSRYIEHGVKLLMFVISAFYSGAFTTISHSYSSMFIHLVVETFFHLVILEQLGITGNFNIHTLHSFFGPVGGFYSLLPP